MIPFFGIRTISVLFLLGKEIPETLLYYLVSAFWSSWNWFGWVCYLASYEA
jgi:hypothetical protein